MVRIPLGASGHILSLRRTRKRKAWRGSREKMNKIGRGNNFWNSQDVLQGWYFDGFGFAACLLESRLRECFCYSIKQPKAACPPCFSNALQCLVSSPVIGVGFVVNLLFGWSWQVQSSLYPLYSVCLLFLVKLFFFLSKVDNSNGRAEAMPFTTEKYFSDGW